MPRKPKTIKQEDGDMVIRPTVTMEPVDNVGTVTVELGQPEYSADDEDAAAIPDPVPAERPLAASQSSIPSDQLEAIIVTVLSRVQNRLDSMVVAKVNSALAGLNAQQSPVGLPVRVLPIAPTASSHKEALAALGIPESDVLSHREDDKGNFVIVTIHGKKHIVQRAR